MSSERKMIMGWVKVCVAPEIFTSRCDDVLMQLMAVRSALDGVASHLVLNHVQDCVKTLPADQATESVSNTVRSLLKLSPVPLPDTPDQ